MKLPVVSSEGKQIRSLEVDDSVFGIKPNQAVLHQAFVTQRNNQRAGTASTKTRGLVQGSTRKMRMQKYTGRARHGGIRAPIFVGGGIVFGPQPRDFGIAINKKMRRLAIRSALSGKVADGQLIVIDELSLSAPRTKEVLRILRNVGVERSALIVTGQPDRTVLASARNLQKTKVLPAAYLNVADMLNHSHVLMTEEAIKVAEGLWGRKRAAVRPSRRAAPAPAAEAPRRRRVKAETPPEAAAEVAPPAEAPEAPKRAAGRPVRDARPSGRKRAKAETAPPAAPAAKPRARRAASAARETPAAAKPARSRAGAAKTPATKAEAPKKPAKKTEAAKKPAPRAKPSAAADAAKPRARARKPKGPE